MNAQPVAAIDAMLDLEHATKVAARNWGNAELPAPDTNATSPLVDRALWRAAGEAGLLGVQCPAEFGGSDCGAVSAALRFEGLGESSGDSGAVFALAAQAFTANRAVAIAGSPEQKAQWLPPLVDGSLFASFAMTETESGSDPWSIDTAATQQADGTWLLNGAKAWATLAPIADMAVVFAKTAPDRGQWGISTFLVDLALPGATRGTPEALMGMAMCPVGSLTFENCHLPADALLGAPGSGAGVFSAVVEAERAFLYASLIGRSRRSLDLSVRYARSRHQAGVHIGSHQAVSHRLVAMKARHESARLLLYKATALADTGQSTAAAAALTKLAAAEGCVDSALEAMRTFGALGYATATGLEDELRNTLAGLAFSGTTDVTRNLLASTLGLSRPL